MGEYLTAALFDGRERMRAATSARRIADRSGVQVARHDSPARIVVAGSHEQLLGPQDAGKVPELGHA